MLSLRSIASAFAVSFASAALAGCSGASDEDTASMGSSADALGFLVTPDKLAAVGTQDGMFAYQSNNGLNRGYAIPAPYSACSPTPFAYKFIGTADALGTSGNPSGAFTLLDAGTTGFSRLRAALAATGHSLADFSFQFGGFTLRETAFPLAAVQASPDHTESRHYGSGFVRIQLRERDGYFHDLLQATPSDLALDIRYKNPSNCSDDVIHGEVAVTNLRPYPWRYVSAGAEQVANALIDDLMHSENAVPATSTETLQTATGPAASLVPIAARPAAPTSQVLAAQRTLVFSFTGMQPSVRNTDVHAGPLVGSRFTAGPGSIQAF